MSTQEATNARLIAALRKQTGSLGQQIAELRRSTPSVAGATSSSAGVVRLATDAEAEAGALTDVAVTPSQLGQFGGGGGGSGYFPSGW